MISFLADFVTAIPEVLFEAIILPILGVIAIGFVLEGTARAPSVPRKPSKSPTR